MALVHRGLEANPVSSRSSPFLKLCYSIDGAATSKLQLNAYFPGLPALRIVAIPRTSSAADFAQKKHCKISRTLADCCSLGKSV
jgi:hypothetical protein